MAALVAPKAIGFSLKNSVADKTSDAMYSFVVPFSASCFLSSFFRFFSSAFSLLFSAFDFYRI
jgi:hypothetical protein